MHYLTLNSHFLLYFESYKGIIQATNQKEKKYIGLCDSTFKNSFDRHKTSFTNAKYMHNTALSIEYWCLKNARHTPKVTWRVIETSKAFNPELKKCHLCLSEKFCIATYKDQDKPLNKRSKIVSKCRHRRKFELSLFDSADWCQWCYCIEDLSVFLFL